MTGRDTAKDRTSFLRSLRAVREFRDEPVPRREALATTPGPLPA